MTHETTYPEELASRSEVNRLARDFIAVAWMDERGPLRRALTIARSEMLDHVRIYREAARANGDAPGGAYCRWKVNRNERAFRRIQAIAERHYRLTFPR
jgi:hypothetical protein